MYISYGFTSHILGSLDFCIGGRLVLFYCRFDIWITILFNFPENAKLFELFYHIGYKLFRAVIVIKGKYTIEESRNNQHAKNEILR